MSDCFNFLNVCDIKDDAAVIYCGGLGTSTTPHSGKHHEITHMKFTYDIINYDTRGVFNDAIELIRNIGTLYGTNQNIGRRKRLESIVDTIISHQDRSQIILFGISHGSIILHLALLRLKTRSGFEPTLDFMKKIVFVTVGSPHPPHGMLLHRYETGKIHNYNFYHLDDSVLQKTFIKLGLQLANATNPFIPTPTSANQVVPCIYKSFPTSKPIIKYNTVKRICIIQYKFGYIFDGIGSHVSTILAYPFFFKTLYKNIQQVYIMPKDEVMINALRTIFEIGDTASIQILSAANTNLLFSICNSGIFNDLIMLSAKETKGGSVVVMRKYLELKKSKKTYIVHIDNKINKPYIRVSNQRVFLGDIRNTYRYLS